MAAAIPLLAGAASAQVQGIGALLAPSPSGLPPIGQAPVGQAPVSQPYLPPAAPAPVDPAATDPHPSQPYVYAGRISDSDAAALRAALTAARSGSRDRYEAAAGQIFNAEARRIAHWAFVDAAGEQLGFHDLDRARTELAAWPRASRRQTLTEKALERGGLAPRATVAWFQGEAPTTAEGAMALASALVVLGREPEARALIVGYWRDRSFEADAQRNMQTRFGAWLSEADHIKRLDTLLMGPQGPAAQQMLPLVPAGHQQLAQARMALRAGRPNALDQAALLPADLQQDSGLAYEKARYLRSKGRTNEGFELLARWPQAPSHDDGQARLYTESRHYFIAALQARNWQAAYNAMAGRAFPGGERRAESDFFAGWVALTKLNNPAAATQHFESVRVAGRTPLTQGRAAYWLGRAHDELGQKDQAQGFYRYGSQFVGAFYGQLAAEKAGYTTITLPAEPNPSQAERDAFEAGDVVRAIRILSQVGEENLFKAFVNHLDDNLSSAEEFALLIDMVRNEGQPFTAMMVGRAAAGKGFILPERMYPVLLTPQVANAPDPAFVLAITRQESSFDPRARSPADARGMMMLLPSTARIVARQMGVPFEEGRLYEAGYNMQLGTYHLGDLLGKVSGSYILTAAGYNAGPGRPARWIGECGDPRSSFTDPLDFIECVPFTETRDYMMRVMENMQVYRARLNGGTGPLTLSAELKRGGYAIAETGAVPPPAAR